MVYTPSQKRSYPQPDTLYFFVLLLIGMGKANNDLDLAANELAYSYTLQIDNNKELFPGKGIVKYFVAKSPAFCSEIKAIYSEIECAKYSDNFYFALLGLIIAWLFSMALFWPESIWIKVRKNKKLNT